MLLESIQIRNLLSFGPSTERLTLGPLNVLIGPNGSGKSNLIDVIGLLRSAPRNLSEWVSQSGGIRDWLWKGAISPTAQIDAIVSYQSHQLPLRHVIEFAETAQHLELRDERIENSEPYPGYADPLFYYRYQRGSPVLRVADTERPLQRESVKLDESILSQRRDPDQYPAITYLAEQFEQIRIFREWSFGRSNVVRWPQKADQKNYFLGEDFLNLGLVLNQLRKDPPVKRHLLEHLRNLYPGVDDFEINVEGGTVQIFFQEGDLAIPATRLSDGTLRFLCLLAVLCHPQPPPLICIEEPELGLHPDILPEIAKLLIEASERTQLVVTTHSNILVDGLSEVPESIVVCEKPAGCSVMHRTDAASLNEWLERYTLGELWRRGEIGGNRW